MSSEVSGIDVQPAPTPAPTEAAQAAQQEEQNIYDMAAEEQAQQQADDAAQAKADEEAAAKALEEERKRAEEARKEEERRAEEARRKDEAEAAQKEQQQQADELAQKEALKDVQAQNAKNEIDEVLDEVDDPRMAAVYKELSDRFGDMSEKTLDVFEQFLNNQDKEIDVSELSGEELSDLLSSFQYLKMNSLGEDWKNDVSYVGDADTVVESMVEKLSQSYKDGEISYDDYSEALASIEFTMDKSEYDKNSDKIKDLSKEILGEDFDFTKFNEQERIFNAKEIVYDKQQEYREDRAAKEQRENLIDVYNNFQNAKDEYEQLKESGADEKVLNDMMSEYQKYAEQDFSARMEYFKIDSDDFRKFLESTGGNFKFKDGTQVTFIKQEDNTWKLDALSYEPVNPDVKVTYEEYQSAKTEHDEAELGDGASEMHKKQLQETAEADVAARGKYTVTQREDGIIEHRIYEDGTQATFIKQQDGTWKLDASSYEPINPDTLGIDSDLSSEEINPVDVVSFNLNNKNYYKDMQGRCYRVGANGIPEQIPEEYFNKIYSDNKQNLENIKTAEDKDEQQTGVVLFNVNDKSYYRSANGKYYENGPDGKRELTPEEYNTILNNSENAKVKIVKTTPEEEEFKSILEYQKYDIDKELANEKGNRHEVTLPDGTKAVYIKRDGKWIFDKSSYKPGSAKDEMLDMEASRTIYEMKQEKRYGGQITPEKEDEHRKSLENFITSLKIIGTDTSSDGNTKTVLLQGGTVAIYNLDENGNWVLNLDKTKIVTKGSYTDTGYRKSDASKKEYNSEATPANNSSGNSSAGTTSNAIDAINRGVRKGSTRSGSNNYKVTPTTISSDSKRASDILNKILENSRQSNSSKTSTNSNILNKNKNASSANGTGKNTRSVNGVRSLINRVFNAAKKLVKSSSAKTVNANTQNSSVSAVISNTNNNINGAKTVDIESQSLESLNNSKNLIENNLENVEGILQSVEDDTISVLQDALSDYQDSVDEYMDAMHFADSEICKEMKSQIDLIDDNISLKEKEIDSCNEQIRSTKDAISQQTDLINNLDGIISNYSYTISGLKRDLKGIEDNETKDAIKAQIKQYEDLQAEAERQRVKALKEKSELSGQLLVLSHQKSQCAIEIAQFTNQKVDIMLQMNSSKSQMIQNAREKMMISKAAYENTKTKMSQQLEYQISNAEIQLVNIQNSLNDFEESLPVNLQADNSSNASKNSSFTTGSEDFVTEKEQSQKITYQNTMQSIANVGSSYNPDITFNNDNNQEDGYSSLYQVMSEGNDKLASDLSRNKSNATGLQENINSTNSKIFSLQDTISGIGVRLSGINEEFSALGKEKAILQSDYSSDMDKNQVLEIKKHQEEIERKMEELVIEQERLQNREKTEERKLTHENNIKDLYEMEYFSSSQGYEQAYMEAMKIAQRLQEDDEEES